MTRATKDERAAALRAMFDGLAARAANPGTKRARKRQTKSRHIAERRHFQIKGQ